MKIQELFPSRRDKRAGTPCQTRDLEPLGPSPKICSSFSKSKMEKSVIPRSPVTIKYNINERLDRFVKLVSDQVSRDCGEYFAPFE